MSDFVFQRATKRESYLRFAIVGASGSGKTWSSLVFATALNTALGKPARGRGGIAVIDTERGSASKYADKFEFEVLNLDSFEAENYIAAIKAAEQEGYNVLVIDSLSHAWEGVGGILEQHDKATKRSKSQNSYMAWGEVTPVHRALVDAILQSKIHVIATMRAKTEYVLEDVNGRQVPRRVGMAPVQRQGMEYEFDIVGDIDLTHNMSISKSRCFEIADAVINKPDGQWFSKVIAWITDGEARLHWYDDIPTREKFEGFLAKNNLSTDHVLTMLGVESIRDMRVTPREACEVILKRKAALDAAAPMTEEDLDIIDAAAEEEVPDDEPEVYMAEPLDAPYAG